MADIKENVSNRQKYEERLKSKYPDKEYADDEALFGQINDDYDEYDSKIKGYEDESKAISDMIGNDPRAASFLSDWHKGENPVVGLVRRYGPDFSEALSNPANAEALAEAEREYTEKVTKEKKYEAEYEKNLDESLATLERLKTEKGLSDDEIDKGMDFLIAIVRDGLLGKFTAENIEFALKAINHDMDVSVASEEGEIRGRNAKIQEKLRKVGANDGTANLGSRNTSNQRQAPQDIFALAREAK